MTVGAGGRRANRMIASPFLNRVSQVRFLPGAHNRTYRLDLKMPWSAARAGPLELSQVAPPALPTTSGVFYVGTSTRCELAQVRALPPGRSVSPARPSGYLRAKARALHASPESDAIIVPKPQDLHSSA